MSFDSPCDCEFCCSSMIEHINLLPAFEAEAESNVQAESKISVIKCCPNIHEPTVKPLSDQTFGDCPICYEQLNMINVTVTRCGHVMHSSCVFTALENAPCCPMCRTQLMREVEEDEDDEEEEQDEDEEEEQDEDDESEENDTRVSVEQLATKLQNMGFTPVDFLMMYFSGDNIKTDKQDRYSEEFLSKLDDSVYGLLNGSISMNIRDKRSYAEVVVSSLV